MNRKQLLCLLCATVIVLSFFFSVYLTLGHECVHETCTVCAMVTTLKGVLEALCILWVIRGLPTLLQNRRRLAGDVRRTPQQAWTPITLKVKLSDSLNKGEELSREMDTLYREFSLWLSGWEM